MSPTSTTPPLTDSTECTQAAPASMTPSGRCTPRRRCRCRSTAPRRPFECAPSAAQPSESPPCGKQCKAWPGRALWHMRSLLATEKVDLLIGNPYGKYLERDVGTPLIRLMFPIFDRHHHHRFPVWGYQGALRVLVTL